MAMARALDSAPFHLLCTEGEWYATQQTAHEAAAEFRGDCRELPSAWVSPISPKLGTKSLCCTKIEFELSGLRVTAADGE